MEIQPLIDFMGDELTLKSFNVCVRRSSLKKPVHVPTMGFVNNHWVARLPGDKKPFNPYDRCQKPGTHEFCQTYSLMYLLGKLPSGNYTQCALDFIQKTIEDFSPRDQVFWGMTDQGPRIGKRRLLRCIPSVESASSGCY